MEDVEVLLLAPPGHAPSPQLGASTRACEASRGARSINNASVRQRDAMSAGTVALALQCFTSTLLES